MESGIRSMDWPEHDNRSYEEEENPIYYGINSTGAIAKETVDVGHVDFWKTVQFASLAVIIPVGIVLNTLAFLVFVTSHRMRNSVPGRYFLSLAAADNLVLIAELLSWLNSSTSTGPILGLNFRDNIDVLCKVINFLRYGSRILSSWITVAITAERYVSVAYPLRAISSYNRVKPIIVVCVEIVVCFALASYSIFLLEVKMYEGNLICLYPNAKLYMAILVVINGILGELLIPSVVVLVLTILIIKNMFLASRRRRNHLSAAGKRNDMQFPTIALLAIAITFLVVRTPYMIIFLLQHTLSDSFDTRTLYVAHKLAYVLAVSNYSLNFILFCITGESFRKELKRFLACKTQRKRGGQLLTSSVSNNTNNTSVEMQHLENNAPRLAIII